MVGASNGKPGWWITGGGGCQPGPRFGLWEPRKILSDRVTHLNKTHKNDHMESITDSQSARMLTLAAYLLGVKLMCKHLRSELRGREYFHFYLFFFLPLHILVLCFLIPHVILWRLAAGVPQGSVFGLLCFLKATSWKSESSDTTYLSDLARIASGLGQGHRTWPAQPGRRLEVREAGTRSCPCRRSARTQTTHRQTHIHH